MVRIAIKEMEARQQRFFCAWEGTREFLRMKDFGRFSRKEVILFVPPTSSSTDG